MSKVQDRYLRNRTNFHPLTVPLSDEIAACLSGQGVIPYSIIDQKIKDHVAAHGAEADRRFVEALQKIAHGAMADNKLAGDIAREVLIKAGLLYPSEEGTR